MMYFMLQMLPVMQNTSQHGGIGVHTCQNVHVAGLILGLHPANGGRRYKVTPAGGKHRISLASVAH